MSRRPGRNAPCPCGSGKKFKRCHGGPDATTEEMISRGAEQAQRAATIHRIQRERQQGLGRPIVATQMQDRRFVAVGSRLFQGNWQTFHDFLVSYASDVLGQNWFATQSGLAESQQHPIEQWRQKLITQSKALVIDSGPIRRMAWTGAASAYLTLAYDLYTLEHNSELTRTSGLGKSLINRLKHPEQFIGVRYEIKVAAMLLRAGFELEWEDESDRKRTHVEYTATYPATSRSFGVECKIRNKDRSAKSERGFGKFVGLVSDALKKGTPFERLIFVDLNTPGYPHVSGSEHDWRTIAISALRKFELQPLAQKLPPAVVIITNYPDHYHLDTEVPDFGAVVEGFRMDDFRTGQLMSLQQKIEMRERNVEIDGLLASMQEHIEVPATFEGEIFGLEANRLLIGHSYEADDGTVGVLEDATVMESTQTAWAILKLEDGRRVVSQIPLTDAELAAYKRYPETFFGEIRQPQQVIDDPLDFYDRMRSVYASTSKEQLLSYMSVDGVPVPAELERLSQAELLELYVQGITNFASARGSPQVVPPHIRRLKPPPRQAG